MERKQIGISNKIGKWRLILSKNTQDFYENYTIALDRLYHNKKFLLANALITTGLYFILYG